MFSFAPPLPMPVPILMALIYTPSPSPARDCAVWFLAGFSVKRERGLPLPLFSLPRPVARSVSNLRRHIPLRLDLR